MHRLKYTEFGHCTDDRVCDTARSVEDETRNARWNAKRIPEWCSQVSFQKVHLKRDMNFDHRGFRLAFRRAFSHFLRNGL